MPNPGVGEPDRSGHPIVAIEVVRSAGTQIVKALAHEPPGAAGLRLFGSHRRPGRFAPIGAVRLQRARRSICPVAVAQTNVAVDFL